MLGGRPGESGDIAIPDLISRLIEISEGSSRNFKYRVGIIPACRRVQRIPKGGGEIFNFVVSHATGSEG